MYQIILMTLKETSRSWDSSVCTGYGTDNQGLIPGWEFFSSPQCPDQLWSTTSILSNWYQVSFSRVQSWPLTPI